MRQAGEVGAQGERGVVPRAAVGQQQEAQAGVDEGVDALHADPGGVARAERKAARLVLRTARLDPQLVAAERHARRDRPHTGQRRQAQAQPLEGADEGALVDHGAAEERAGESVGRVAEGHVLGPEEHLHPAPAARGLGARGERELDRPEAHPRGRAVAHHQVGGAEEGGDELGLGAQVELLRRPGLEQAAAGEDGQAVGELEGLLLVVGDEQGGDAELALHVADGAPQLDAHLGVEGAERLVEEQHLRLVGEGAR